MCLDQSAAYFCLSFNRFLFIRHDTFPLTVYQCNLHLHHGVALLNIIRLDPGTAGSLVALSCDNISDSFL